MATINVRLDDNVKREAEILFEHLGLSVSGAINIFFRQAIREQAIPFAIRHKIPNERLLAAMEEGEQIIREYENGTRPKGFATARELIEDILNEEDDDDDEEV